MAQDDFLPKLPRAYVTVGAHVGARGDEGVRLDVDGDRAHFHIGEQGRRVLLGYRRAVAEIARAGVNVVVDEVSLEEHEWLDWCAALAGLEPIWVALRCDLEVALAREVARGDRVLGMVRDQSDLVHRFPVYDLELDSTVASAEELARALDAFVPRSRT